MRKRGVWGRRLAVLGLLLLPLVALDLLFGAGMALYARTIRVTGRLVDSAGVPRPGIRVLTLPSEKWRDDPARVARCRLAVEERERWIADGNEPYPLLLMAGGWTGPDGSFDLRLEVNHCTPMGILRPLLFAEETPPFAGARYLRAELPAGAAVTIDCTTGTWTEHGDGREVFATLDLGTVRVP